VVGPLSAGAYDAMMIQVDSECRRTVRRTLTVTGPLWLHYSCIPFSIPSHPLISFQLSHPISRVISALPHALAHLSLCPEHLSEYIRITLSLIQSPPSTSHPSPSHGKLYPVPSTSPLRTRRGDGVLSPSLIRPRHPTPPPWGAGVGAATPLGGGGGSQGGGGGGSEERRRTTTSSP
jgi:hypothetical protein